MHYPQLKSEHVNDARLFANRYDMLRSLKFPPRPVVCEVGVGLGNFSEFMLNTLDPSRFVAIDWFQAHRDPMVWGRPAAEVFGGKTHGHFYRDRFAHSPVEIMEGDSAATVERLENAAFDLIYIDANHEYAGVKADTEAALKKIKPDGTLIFNDFILYDHLRSTPYGVVQAVHELLNSSDWRIVAFALEHSLFCDVALRRR